MVVSHILRVQEPFFSSIIAMQVGKGRKPGYLRVNSTTWYKDSHSLFDYESTKTTQVQETFSLALTRGVNVYRRKNCPEVLAIDATKPFPKEGESFEFIAHIDFEADKSLPGRARINVIKASTYKKRLNSTSNDKQKTNESFDSIDEPEEQPYFIVNKAQQQGAYGGRGLVPGMTLKLGRIEYYVSQSFDGYNKVNVPLEHSRCFFNDNVYRFRYDPEILMPACKICLDDSNSASNFLFHPCKCKGQSGSVHFECLLQWIQVKIKKEVIGGTQHYNFTKFECEVCKSEFCGFVEVVNGEQPPVMLEMIGIEKPEGRYLVLESVSQKEKSIMVIQNTPQSGIKLGRGHECQIRITDISVSRKHALIFSTPSMGFRILDNSSKFGTLTRQGDMGVTIEEGAGTRVQIGRTLLSFEYLTMP